jgi:uroporphyrinogen-III decarboxylase
MPQDYLLQQRLKRILQAVALEKPDRIPFVLQFSGFAAYVTGIRMAEYLSTPLKATEILGDHMCLMGDVPATMQCLGSREEVYGYSTRLIRELGPEGFILQSGCDVSPNAKLENIRAMVSAATGK